jgi:hypothetical protein
MSEPLAEHLSRFTPDATGLDRDALVFAAGRVSARPSRLWQCLVGALTLSQVLTLVWLWPQTPSSSPAPPSASVVASKPVHVEATGVPASKPDPSEWRVLRQHMFELDANEPMTPSDGPMVSPDPPLHAFGSPPPSLLN